MKIAPSSWGLSLLSLWTITLFGTAEADCDVTINAGTLRDALVRITGRSGTTNPVPVDYANGPVTPSLPTGLYRWSPRANGIGGPARQFDCLTDGTIVNTNNVPIPDNIIDASNLFCALPITGIPATGGTNIRIDTGNNINGQGGANNVVAADSPLTVPINDEVFWRPEANNIIGQWSTVGLATGSTSGTTCDNSLDVSGGFCALTMTGFPTGSRIDIRRSDGNGGRNDLDEDDSGLSLPVDTTFIWRTDIGGVQGDYLNSFNTGTASGTGTCSSPLDVSTGFANMPSAVPSLAPSEMPSESIAPSVENSCTVTINAGTLPGSLVRIRGRTVSGVTTPDPDPRDYANNGETVILPPGFYRWNPLANGFFGSQVNFRCFDTTGTTNLNGGTDTIDAADSFCSLDIDNLPTGGRADLGFIRPSDNDQRSPGPSRNIEASPHTVLANDDINWRAQDALGNEGDWSAELNTGTPSSTGGTCPTSIDVDNEFCTLSITNFPTDPVNGNTFNIQINIESGASTIQATDPSFPVLVGTTFTYQAEVERILGPTNTFSVGNTGGGACTNSALDASGLFCQLPLIIPKDPITGLGRIDMAVDSNPPPNGSGGPRQVDTDSILLPVGSSFIWRGDIDQQQPPFFDYSFNVGDCSMTLDTNEGFCTQQIGGGSIDMWAGVFPGGTLSDGDSFLVPKNLVVNYTVPPDTTVEFFDVGDCENFLPSNLPVAGGGGDPHITPWHGKRYAFHGECDLVMICSAEFGSGAGMCLHVRTKISQIKGSYFSFIANAALLIGKEVLEVTEAKHYLNGVENATLTDLAGYAITTERVGDEQVIYKVKLGNGGFIHLKVYKHYVTIRMSAAEQDMFDAVGLLGTYQTGTLLARDSLTVMQDYNSFGQEWQVHQNEPRLFHEKLRAPQHPAEKCRMPPKDDQMRRRLRGSENTNLVLAAKEACAHRIDKEDNEACLFDVLATGDIGLAKAGQV